MLYHQKSLAQVKEGSRLLAVSQTFSPLMRRFDWRQNHTSVTNAFEKSDYAVPAASARSFPTVPVSAFPRNPQARARSERVPRAGERRGEPVGPRGKAGDGASGLRTGSVPSQLFRFRGRHPLSPSSGTASSSSFRSWHGSAPAARESKTNSRTSSRRSIFSIRPTYCCGLPIFAASCSCVIPAAFRACRRALTSAWYSGRWRVATCKCRSGWTK
jgi:hypothetical protein